MAQVRKIAGLAVLSALGVAAVLWIAAGAWAMSIGPAWISSQLKARAGWDVSVGSARTNFINSVTLRDVAFLAPASGRVEAVRLSFRPWNLLALRTRDRHLFRVALKNPQIDLPESAFSTVSKERKGPLKIIPFGATVSGGRLRLIRGTRTIEASDLDAVVGVTPFRIEGEADFDVAGVGRIESRLRAACTPPKNWEVRVLGEAIDVAGLAGLMPESKRPDGAVSGTAGGELTLKGTWGETTELADWRLKANTDAVSWKRRPALAAMTLAGKLDATPRTVKLSPLRWGTGASIEGEIRNPLREPVMDLTLTLTGQKLEEIVGAMWPSAPAIEGTISGTARVSGQPKSPDINATYEVNGGVGRLAFPPASGHLTLNAGQLDSTTTFAGGQMTVTGVGVAGIGPVWSVNARDISLAAIATANGWQDVDGAIGARFMIRGARPAITGRVDLTPVRWGRLQFAGTHGASIRFTREELIVRADDGSISATAFRNGPIVDLQTLNLALAGAGSVSASGNINLETKAIDLDAEFENISADVWPPLVRRYPRIAGSMAARGRVIGTFTAPVVRLGLSWSDLSFRDGGESFSGEGKLEIDPEVAAIREATWASGYSGEGVYHRRTGHWESRLDLLDASPAFLWDVMRAAGEATGVVTGIVRAEGGDRSVVASSFTWASGRIREFSFDELSGSLDWDGAHVTVRNAAVVKGSQAIRGQADVDRSGTSWSFDTVAQIQHWGPAPLTVDGEVRALGRFDSRDESFRAAVDAPVFWVADRSLENLKATVTGVGPKVTLAGTSDERATFNLSMDRQSGHLAGRFSAHDLRLADVFPKPAEGAEAGPATPPDGVYDVDATIGGTIAEPEARVRASIRDGRWRLEPFQADVLLDVTRSTITIGSARANLAAGGELYASGTVGVGKEGAVRVEGAGKDVDLQAFFHLMWWPVKWAGRADASFLLTRDDGPIAASIKFNGEHDGFGPFRDGGELRGEIIGRDREWELGGVLVESGDGFMALKNGSKLYMDKGGSATLRAVADVRNVKLGPVALFGGVEAVGRWQGEPGKENAGRRVDIDVFARSLWMNQFVLDGNLTHMTIINKSIEFSPIPGSGQQLGGSLSYADYPDLIMKDFTFLEGGAEKLFLTGNVGTRAWDFSLRARDVDASVVRGLLDTSVAMSGPMDLDIAGRGNPARPEISGSVRWTDGWAGILPLDEARGRFTYLDGDVHMDDVVVQKRRGYQMKGNARLGFGEARDNVPLEINLQVDRGDLTMLEDMFPDVSSARGSFEGRLRIGGSAGLTTISGFMNAQKIAVRSAYTPDLDRGELRLRFEKDRLLVDTAVARLGRGDVVGSGFVDFENGTPARYELSLKSDGRYGASIRVPQLAIAPGPVLGRISLFKKKLAGVSRGEPVVDLEFTGPAANPTLAGTIVLDNTVFTYPPAKSGSDGGWARKFLDRMNWDLTFIAGRRAWYQNELVDAGVAGSMNIRGPKGDLEVTGKVSSDQGSIVYSGNEFRIREAELEVETRRPVLATDQKQIVVYLKATAEKEVFYTDGLNNSNHEVIVMVVDRAPVGEIQPRFYAKNNPGLSSQRALQLALGLPFGEAIERNSLLPDQRERVSDQADTDKMLRLGLIQLLDSSLASPLARAIARNTGLVDFIRVTYQENDPHAQEGIAEFEDRTGATDVTQNEFLKYAKGTKVRFGRGLGRRLFADYSFRVDEYESELNLRHELELAYRLHRNIFLRGTSELDRERELGRPPDRRAILENQWRFGLPRRKEPQSGQPRGDAGASPAKAG